MARRALWALMPLVACLSAGCLLPGTEPPAIQSMARFRPELGRDAVIMDIALVERTLGDRFLNTDVWQHTDQMVVDLDRKAVLEDNGIRVGQIIGPTSVQLQNLLNSTRWNEKPRRRVMPAGQTDRKELGGVHQHCAYDIYLAGKKIDVQADQARFVLDITATPTDDGQTKLRFVPKVETGDPMLPFHPVPEQSTWVFRIERAAKAYPELSWDVTLRPNEYLIVGAWRHKEGTIGHRALIQDEPPEPVQRLLVIRTARPLAGAPDEPSFDDFVRASASPPLAVQATLGAVRGSRP